MKKYALYVLIITLILNLLGFLQFFCDLYSKTVYGYLADAFGFLWSKVPLPMGEILMYLGALLLVLLVVFSLLFIFLQKRKGYVTFATTYIKCIICITATVLLLYTLNWSLPLRGSVLGEGKVTEREYTLAEYEILRNFITQNMNEAVHEVERDADGNIVLLDRKEAQEKIVASMKALAAEYPRLKGYYPPMKEALCSDVLDWMDIGGYTYPYTLEVTCNKYINDLYYPALFAHESSHHQGFYRESEANFIEFLACVKSDDPRIRLAGYLYTYNYVDNAYQSKLMEAYNTDDAIARYDSQIKVDPQVGIDQAYARKLAIANYEKDEHPLEQYSETAEKVADKGWSTQERILQEDNYDGVVPLLLHYFHDN
ncbi:MAG: DUF3810 family protein [Lachnospiraceae bacterium]|nr:DUF3810 family protein [Lachnospiraceae bacterium]